MSTHQKAAPAAVSKSTPRADKLKAKQDWRGSRKKPWLRRWSSSLLTRMLNTMRANRSRLLSRITEGAALGRTTL